MSVTKKDNEQFKKGVIGWLSDCEKKKKSIKKRITHLFKKWIVKRPKGQCQVLFSIHELDRLVDEILSELE